MIFIPSIFMQKYVLPYLENFHFCRDNALYSVYPTGSDTALRSSIFSEIYRFLVFASLNNV